MDEGRPVSAMICWIYGRFNMVAHLFLIADEQECQTAIGMIERYELDDSAVLKLNNEPDYLENIDSRSKYVKRWEECGIHHIKLYTFATNGYKYAEDMFSDYLNGREELPPVLIESKCFQLPFLMNMAKDHLAPIFLLNQFIVETNPDIVFMNERAGFATELVSALTAAYGISLRSIRH